MQPPNAQNREKQKIRILAAADAILITHIAKLPPTASIGVGPTGSVYLATYHGTQVAVKAFHSSVLHEAQKPDLAQYTMQHPALLPTYGFIATPGKFSLVSLLAIPLPGIYTHANLTSQDLIAIAEAIHQGLAYLHAYQIAHDNLKTSNVLVHPTSNQIMLADWGLSTIRPACWQTPKGRPHQTLRYRAPERTANSHASATQRKLEDLYAAGVILTEVAYRKPPFHPLTEEEAYDLFQTQATPLTHLATQEAAPGLDCSPLTAFAIQQETRRRKDALLQTHTAKLAALTLTSQEEAAWIAKKAPKLQLKKALVTIQTEEDLTRAYTFAPKSLHTVMPEPLHPIVFAALGPPTRRLTAEQVLDKLNHPDCNLAASKLAWTRKHLPPLLQQVTLPTNSRG